MNRSSPHDSSGRRASFAVLNPTRHGLSRQDLLHLTESARTALRTDAVELRRLIDQSNGSLNDAQKLQLHARLNPQVPNVIWHGENGWREALEELLLKDEKLLNGWRSVPSAPGMAASFRWAFSLPWPEAKDLTGLLPGLRVWFDAALDGDAPEREAGTRLQAWLVRHVQPSVEVLGAGVQIMRIARGPGMDVLEAGPAVRIQAHSPLPENRASCLVAWFDLSASTKLPATLLDYLRAGRKATGAIQAARLDSLATKPDPPLSLLLPALLTLFVEWPRRVTRDEWLKGTESLIAQSKPAPAGWLTALDWHVRAGSIAWRDLLAGSLPWLLKTAPWPDVARKGADLVERITAPLSSAASERSSLLGEFCRRVRGLPDGTRPAALHVLATAAETLGVNSGPVMALKEMLVFGSRYPLPAEAYGPVMEKLCGVAAPVKKTLENALCEIIHHAPASHLGEVLERLIPLIPALERESLLTSPTLEAVALRLRASVPPVMADTWQAASTQPVQSFVHALMSFVAGLKTLDAQPLWQLSLFHAINALLPPDPVSSRAGDGSPARYPASYWPWLATWLQPSSPAETSDPLLRALLRECAMAWIPQDLAQPGTWFDPLKNVKDKLPGLRGALAEAWWKRFDDARTRGADTSALWHHALAQFSTVWAREYNVAPPRFCRFAWECRDWAIAILADGFDDAPAEWVLLEFLHATPSALAWWKERPEIFTTASPPAPLAWDRCLERLESSLRSGMVTPDDTVACLEALGAWTRPDRLDFLAALRACFPNAMVDVLPLLTAALRSSPAIASDLLRQRFSTSWAPTACRLLCNSEDQNLTLLVNAWQNLIGSLPSEWLRELAHLWSHQLPPPKNAGNSSNALVTLKKILPDAALAQALALNHPLCAQIIGRMLLNSPAETAACVDWLAAQAAAGTAAWRAEVGERIAQAWFTPAGSDWKLPDEAVITELMNIVQPARTEICAKLMKLASIEPVEKARLLRALCGADAAMAARHFTLEAWDIAAGLRDHDANAAADLVRMNLPP